MGHPNFTVWAFGYVGYLILAAVIVYRRRYRAFPWFSALLAFDILHSTALTGLLLAHNKKVYGLVYLVGEIIETAIRLGVMLELARSASKHMSEGVGRNTRWLNYSLILAGVATAVFVWNMRGLHNHFANVAIKVSFGTAIMGWVLAFTLFLITFFGGIRFRAHSQTITYGLAIYFTGKILTGVMLLLGEKGMWAEAQNMLQPVYIACLYAWSVSFWFDEPRRILNLEMDNFKHFVTRAATMLS